MRIPALATVLLATSCVAFACGGGSESAGSGPGAAAAAGAAEAAGASTEGSLEALGIDTDLGPPLDPSLS